MSNESNPLPIMLHHFRKKKKLTQAQVAEMLSISRAGYASYESGRVIPNFDHISKLSKILEHDFLFAYAVSSQNHLDENTHYLDYVFEEHPYKINNDYNSSVEKKVRQKKISYFDNELIEAYKLLREKKEDKGENK